MAHPIRKRFPIFLAIVNLLAACSLTLWSVQYQYPHNCIAYCWQEPCKPGHCPNVVAGFPIPFIFDESAGSPVNSWGKILLDDFDNYPMLTAAGFGLNVLIYMMLFIGLFKLLAWIKRAAGAI
jgi:hypothetical protein